MERPEIRLRGHHLICLHFFKGEGYNREFIENLAEILRRAGSGEKIRVYPGADDVCKICPYLKNDECSYDNNAEDEIKAMDKAALALLGINHGELVRWQAIEEKVPAIFRDWAGRYCADCDWKGVCEKLPSFRQMI